MSSREVEQLRSFSDSILEATHALKRVKPEMQECLLPISECVLLINWLKERLKGNMQYLLRFVEQQISQISRIC